jgi:hypothetical protein
MKICEVLADMLFLNQLPDKIRTWMHDSSVSFRTLDNGIHKALLVSLPAHSSDLALLDIFKFPKLKTALNGNISLEATRNIRDDGSEYLPKT